MGELKQMHVSDQEKIRAAAVALAEESPELVMAYIDYRRDRSSGMMEVHFSQGGIAKVFAKVTKTYK